MVDSGQTKTKRHELHGIVSPLILVENGYVVPSGGIEGVCDARFPVISLEFRGFAVQASPIPGKPANPVE